MEGGKDVNEDELRDEAEELLERLSDRASGLNAKDSEFVSSLLERFEQYGERTRVTRPQVFWLRDIAERAGA